VVEELLTVYQRHQSVKLPRSWSWAKTHESAAAKTRKFSTFSIYVMFTGYWRRERVRWSPRGKRQNIDWSNWDDAGFSSDSIRALVEFDSPHLYQNRNAADLSHLDGTCSHRCPGNLATTNWIFESFNFRDDLEACACRVHSWN